MRSLFILIALVVVFRINSQEQSSTKDKNIDAIVRESNILALQMYNILKEGKDNTVISPYAISASMGLAFTGAEGSTESQMARILRFRSPKPIITKAFGWLNENLIERSPYFAAESIWLQKGAVNSEFKDTIENDFRGSVRLVDFVTRADGVRVEMNAWIKERSQGKVTDMVKNKEIPSSARMVLLSGAYVKGRWEQTFDTRFSQQSAFFGDRYSTFTVPTMFAIGNFNFLEEAKFSMVEFPYEARRRGDVQLSLIILLPHDTHGLKSISKELTADKLDKFLSSMKKSKLSVTLPRFSVADSFSLKEIFAGLGLSDPFNDDANFSNIREKPDLKLSMILHKAVYSIDEWGSGGGVSMGGGETNDGGSPFRFSVDHPFMFLVADRTTGLILMIGHISTP